MSDARRSRTPWIAWGVAVALLALTLTLAILNRFHEDDDTFLILAITTIVGYTTAGSVLASRMAGGRIGWLMISIGGLFAVVGLSSEYSTYAYRTDPGSLPLPAVIAVVSNSAWLPMFAAWSLLVLLFPTGRVPGSRWRFLPPAILTLTTMFLLGSLLIPGPLEDLDVGVRVMNPFGVAALGRVPEIVAFVGFVGVLASVVLSFAAMVLRYRRARGEERQQIRWVAHIVATIAATLVVDGLIGLLVGPSYGDKVAPDLFFYLVFALAGLGLPAAVGVAVLRYRLFDLDLVVKKTVLYATVTVLLAAAFVVVAVVIGQLVGRGDTGAIVAAGAIGLSFWPALRLARRIADRVVYGRRATPYEVLSEFSTRVAGSYGSEDVLPRMAQILGDAVGATRATVWLRIGGELRASGVWPADDPPAPVRLAGDALPPLQDAAVEVRDRGELLGALAVSMPASDPIGPTRERLIRDLAAQAGLVLRNVRLIEELRASRQRLVAAQDHERRRIERNIHDGAQQQLVALAVKLRLADSLVGRDDDRAHAMLGELQTETNEALDDLRDLARGIYPPLLADQGLPAALEAQARRSPVSIDLSSDGVGRYSPDVEAAVYFCALEALQNVAKYAGANRVRLRLRAMNGTLGFEVEDDGRGFDPEATSGSGLTNMRDRVDSLGGTLEVRSSPGAGTTITGRLPVAPAAVGT